MLRSGAARRLVVPKYCCNRQYRGGSVSKRRFVSEKQDNDAAISAFAEAIRLDRKYARAYYKRGTAYARRGDYDKAIADYSEAIRLDPQLAEAYCNRGLAYGKKREHDNAIANYTDAIRVDPKYVIAYNYRGFAYGMTGKYDKAIADYNEAIRLDAKNAMAFNYRAAAYDRKGEQGKAISDYTEAIRLDPNLVGAYLAEGLPMRQRAIAPRRSATSPMRFGWTGCWPPPIAAGASSMNRTTKTKVRLPTTPRPFGWSRNARWRITTGAALTRTRANTVRRLLTSAKPGRSIQSMLAPYQRLAWLQATCPDEKYRDGKKAVENATKAKQLSGGKSCRCLDTLAAAFARSGDFEKAKESQAKAIALSLTDKSITEEGRRELRSRFELYIEGKPYREEPRKSANSGPKKGP